MGCLDFVGDIFKGGADITAAKVASNSNKYAVDAQTTAANNAAALQKQAADAALAFEKQQAAQARADNITAQNANYGQFGYRQNTIRPYQSLGVNAANTLGQLLGLPAIDTHLPDLPPPPQFGPQGSAPSSGAPPASPAGVNASNGDIGAQISAYFKSRGVGDQETPYWVQKWAEFGAKDPAYFNKRLAAADSFGSGGSAAPPPTIGSMIGGPVAPTPAGPGVDALTLWQQ